MESEWRDLKYDYSLWKPKLMINSDPAGDGNVLWLGCPIEAVHTHTCPSPQGSSSCCSPVLFAEMLRRITFGQKERKIKKKIKIPACLGGTCRQRATESSSSSWAAFLPCYLPLSKIAFGKVQGGSNANLRQGCVCAHQAGAEFQMRLNTPGCSPKESHLFSSTCLVSNFSLSLWWLEQVFTFTRGSPIPTYSHNF